LSLKLYHGSELQLGYQQSIAEAKLFCMQMAGFKS